MNKKEKIIIQFKNQLQFIFETNREKNDGKIDPMKTQVATIGISVELSCEVLNKQMLFLS